MSGQCDHSKIFIISTMLLHCMLVASTMPSLIASGVNPKNFQAFTALSRRARHSEAGGLDESRTV
ncbi:MAG TPA: hypothetical protein VKM55_04600 [Candidatus Lokiarchaeia archaeon]|nr:hypothetical protein [Candidatus Lokiarchaeia archaeon]